MVALLTLELESIKTSSPKIILDVINFD
jgi:hypothetical protein